MSRTHHGRNCENGLQVVLKSTSSNPLRTRLSVSRRVFGICWNLFTWANFMSVCKSCAKLNIILINFTWQDTVKLCTGRYWERHPDQRVEVGIKIKVSPKTFNDNIHVTNAGFLENITTRRLPMAMFLSLVDIARTFLGYICFWILMDSHLRWSRKASPWS